MKQNLKKIKREISWFRVYYNYKRENDKAVKFDFYTIDTNNANINKLMREFKKWCKEWQGNGYIEIISITAGAYDKAEKWAKKHNAKFAGKKIKFNN